MAKESHNEHTEGSRYGPISTRTQATQTLPVQTQPPTQLMSHEVHQYTQLVHHDSAEHVQGDTLVNDSDEGSGDTIVLDNDDGEPHHVADSGPNDKGLLLARSLENGLNSKPHVHRDLPDSDATTEEGDVENAGYLDADAESRPPHIDAPPADQGGNLSNLLQSSLHEVEGGSENSTQQETPRDALVADTNGSKHSQSKPRSIASVRAAALRASGLRAAGRSASLSSAGKDDSKLDSEATIDLNPGTLNGESNKSPEGFEAEPCGLEEIRLTKAAEFDTMQSSPKVVVPFDNPVTRSPRMSTSRSKSKSVSPTHGYADNAPPEQDDKNHIGSDATIVLKKPQFAEGDHPENISAPLEPLGLGLKRLRSQASIVSSKAFEHEVGGINARPAVEVKVQTEQHSSQKARKLVFDYRETPTNKFGREGYAVSKALNTDGSNGLSKQNSGIHAPARQGSVPSAVRVASANLSYLDSQEPGEESQINALNVVDKLVWLDASCMPADDAATSTVPRDGSGKCHAGAKGLQSLAQAAQMKAVHDKLDVFDWEDSQLDEGASPDKKQGPVNARARKRQLEAPKLTMSSKKQALSHEQKSQAIPPPSDQRVQKSTPDLGKSEVPNAEALCSDEETRLQGLEMKPHTLLTTRLRNRTKAESRPLSKGRQSPGLQRGRKKIAGIKKPKVESSKELETGQRRAGINIKGKVQQAAPESRRGASRKKATDRLGKDYKLEQQKERDNKEEVVTTLQGGLADRTSQDDAAADIWIEAFSNARNKTPTVNSVDLIKFKKRNTSQNETGLGEEKSRTLEPSPLTRDEKHRDTSEQEVTREEDVVGSGSKSQNNLKKSKIIDPATSVRPGSRRVSTRLSRGEQHNLENHCFRDELINREASTKRKLKRSDPSRLKGSIHGEDQDAPERDLTRPEKDEIEREPKAGQDARQNQKVAATVKGRKHGSKAEHMSVQELTDKAVEGAKLERGRKTRSQAQDIKGSDKTNTASKSSTAQETADKKGGTSSSGEAVHADFGTEKPTTKAGRLGKKESLSQQQLMATLSGQEAEPTLLAPASINSMEEVPAGGFRRSKRGREAADDNISESAKATEEASAPARGSKKSKRGREPADASVAEPAKARADVVVQAVEANTNKALQPVEESSCQKEGVSGALRRTRSSTSKGDSQRNEAIDAVKVAQVQGDSTREEHTLKDQVMKSATRTSKTLPQQNKKTKVLRVLENLSGSSVVDKARRRKRESGEIRVLFSHSLTVDTIKHQKKILAKLGGHLVTSALECTHFISNGFIRSQNMLISMAAGKIVATTLWLESCGQAHYFVDEKKYILYDEKKEKEFGFSLMTSLANARRKPLFKDVRVIICSNTTPEPKALKAIVESAGGQVLDTETSLSQSDIESNESLVVIANEKGLDTCSQFLVKGLKVYSEELILHGVVTQSLDFSRNRLFEEFKQQRSSRRT